MPILEAAIGAVLLLFGRSLFWVFVGAAGFFVGAEIAAVALAEQEPWMRLLAAAAAGAGGALIAIVAQKLAFVLGGFGGGAYLAHLILQRTEAPGHPVLWMIAAGIVGAVVAAYIMDWAIIVLSSMVGAGAIVAVLPVDRKVSAIAFGVLAIFGVAVQGRRFRSARDRLTVKVRRLPRDYD